MARMIRRRHLRHGKFSRVRRGDDFLAWLTAEQTDLAGTGAGATVTLGGGTAATGTITLGANPTDGDTVTIGAKTYRFKNTTAQANDVKIGASATATGVNLDKAIQADGTGDGTDYHTGTTANASVTATNATGVVTLTAIESGTAGNSIALSATFTSGSNLVSGSTLSGGTALDTFSKSTHGFVAGDGPFILTAGTTVPGGYTAGELLWIYSAPTTGTFKVTGKRGGREVKSFTYDGVGTLTLTKASTLRTIFELLKRRKPAAISAATDIDSI